MEEIKVIDLGKIRKPEQQQEEFTKLASEGFEIKNSKELVTTRTLVFVKDKIEPNAVETFPIPESEPEPIA